MICPSKIESLPRSTILVALLSVIDYGDIGYVVVVANEHEQNSEAGIYWVGRTLPSMVLTAIGTESRRCFQYKDVRYKVENYEAFQDTKKYLDIIARFCSPASPQTIYVFAQKNLEHFQCENYELVTAMVPCSNSPFPAPITVYYEKLTHRYFINESSYTLARQRYGLPYLRLGLSMEGIIHGSFGSLKEHSELYLLGYSVSTLDGMDTEGRRKLLSEIIDSGVLPKQEIMIHLEWLINTRNGMTHMKNAVDEWKSDLVFISQYHVSSQREIWVNAFKSKYSGFRV